MRVRVVVANGAFFLIAAAQAADKPLLLQPLMKTVVAPQAQALWDVGNRALDEDGKPDVSTLKPADWAKLAKAAQAMKSAAQALADAPKVQVAPSGAKLENEDAPGQKNAGQVQGFIDADPREFAGHARALVDVSDAFFKAAQTKNAQTLADASGRLDEVCEACHTRYWYPDQPK